MPRQENQKRKLFSLLKIFINETDESHGLSMSEIIEKLASDGISAERKSIYDDILTLGEIGFSVVTLPERPPKYTLAERPFELAELKMLVDSVESSRFITRARSRELIAKLKAYAGKYHAHELSRQVYVEDRVKTENSASLDTVDLIHRAINRGQRISFFYFDYTKRKRKIYRRDGKRYVASPASLILSDGNYYLVGYDSEASAYKNFRVDKMAEPKLEDEKMDARMVGERFNPAEYSRKIFGMYGGREELVTLECREHLAGVIIDRFGSEPSFFPTDFGFRVSVRVMISPTFYAWLLGFGKDMRLLSPESAVEGLKISLKETLDYYETK